MTPHSSLMGRCRASGAYVYVEVPEVKAAAGLQCSYIWKHLALLTKARYFGRIESTCILMDPTTKAPLPHATLELYQIVVVSETQQRDQQDKDFAPPAYVITPQTKELIELFFENYKLPSAEKWYELCVFGTPGCGKSCAAKILEGEIRRRIPGARVFYSRSKSQHRLSAGQVSQKKRQKKADQHSSWWINWKMPK